MSHMVPDCKECGEAEEAPMARDIEGEKGTKERILDAALDMFARRGYDGTNLRDLAASLGLSKSAL